MLFIIKSVISTFTLQSAWHSGCNSYDIMTILEINIVFIVLDVLCSKYYLLKLGTILCLIASYSCAALFVIVNGFTVKTNYKVKYEELANQI